MAPTASTSRSNSTRRKQGKSTSSVPTASTSKQAALASEPPEDTNTFAPPPERRKTRTTSQTSSQADSAGTTNKKGKGKRKSFDNAQEEGMEADELLREGSKKKKKKKRTQKRGKSGAFESASLDPVEEDVATEAGVEDDEEGQEETQAVKEDSEEIASREQNSPLAEDAQFAEEEEKDMLEGSEGEEQESAEEEEEEEPLDEDAPEYVTDEVKEKLEDNTESTSFTRITFDREDYTRSGPIRLGDVVELARSREVGDEEVRSSAGYLGVVDEIRALNTDLTPIRDADGAIVMTRSGKPAQTVSKLYVKVSWLFRKQDFKTIPDSWNAFKEQTQVMGPNEAVKSDLTDWDVQTNLILHSRPELVYLFDDCYPAPNASGETSLHPLDFFSTVRLAELSPSPYAKIAISPHLAAEAPASARKVNRARDQAAYFTIPSFYFAVTSTSSLPPSTRLRRPLPATSRPPLPEELFANGQNIKDGLQDATYVRTAFAWKHQTAIEGSGDELTESDKRIWKKVRPDRTDEEPKKLWPLSFSLHSDPPKPYDPLSIQHYSRKSRKWYDIQDLQRLKSYQIQENTEEATDQPANQSAPVSTNGGGGGGPHSVLSQALLEADDSDSDSESGLQASQEHRSEYDTIIAPLLELSKSPIVRGGSYGLTGNCYLVARASWLVHHYHGASSIPPSLPCPTDLRLSPTPVEWIQKSKQVLQELEDWEEGTEQRMLGEGEGEGLKFAWSTDEETLWKRVRRIENLDEDVEMEWICPETKDAI